MTHPQDVPAPSPTGSEALTEHERRVLAFLDQRGLMHRRDVVWELASPDSKIGRARDTGSALGGGSSGNGEALIMGRWCRRLARNGLVYEVRDGFGFYRGHGITCCGRSALRENRL